MSTARSGRRDRRNIAAAIADCVERRTTLVREEIEAAKAEVTKVRGRKLAKRRRAWPAGVFCCALIFVVDRRAWLLYYYHPGSRLGLFGGFFRNGLRLLVVLGVLAGVIAAKVVKNGVLRRLPRWRSKGGPEDQGVGQLARGSPECSGGH